MERMGASSIWDASEGEGADEGGVSLNVVLSDQDSKKIDKILFDTTVCCI